MKPRTRKQRAGPNKNSKQYSATVTPKKTRILKNLPFSLFGGQPREKINRVVNDPAPLLITSLVLLPSIIWAGGLVGIYLVIL